MSRHSRGDRVEHVGEAAHPLGDHPRGVPLDVDEAGVEVGPHEEELQRLLVVGLASQVYYYTGYCISRPDIVLPDRPGAEESGRQGSLSSRGRVSAGSQHRSG